MSNFSHEYLELVKKIFEKRYQRKLTEVEVQLFAERLSGFGKVISNFYKRKYEKYGDKYEVWYKEFSEYARAEEFKESRRIGTNQARTKSKTKK